MAETCMVVWWYQHSIALDPVFNKRAFINYKTVNSTWPDQNPEHNNARFASTAAAKIARRAQPLTDQCSRYFMTGSGVQEECKGESKIISSPLSWRGKKESTFYLFKDSSLAKLNSTSTFATYKQQPTMIWTSGSL